MGYFLLVVSGLEGDMGPISLYKIKKKIILVPFLMLDNIENRYLLVIELRPTQLDSKITENEY